MSPHFVLTKPLNNPENPISNCSSYARRSIMDGNSVDTGGRFIGVLLSHEVIMIRR